MKPGTPSATAGFVAYGVCHASRHPRFKREVPPGVTEMNDRILTTIDGGGMSRRLRLWKAGFLQRMSIPGFYLHFVLRKRHIETQVRETICTGARQIVVLGAGLDSLALRLAQEFQDLRFIEIDHPSTQRVKRNALDQIGTPPNLIFHELDHTRQSLRELLTDSGSYDGSAVTVFVAEGLLMYLPGTEVEEILNTVRDHAAPGSRVVFTFMEKWGRGSFQFRNASPLVNFWLRMKGENFTWGLAPGEAGPFLERHGFELRHLAGSEKLAAELLSPPNRNATTATGEVVATALRS